jgi:hypothetical protein
MVAMNDLRQEPTFSPTPAARPVARPRVHERPIGLMLAMLLVIVAALAALFWVFRPDRLFLASRSIDVPPAAAPAVAPPQPAASVAVLKPVPAEEALGARDVEPALVKLLGRNAVLRFIATGDFPRRFVATVDNLAREEAPLSAWPVHPSPGRFSPDGAAATKTIGEKNARRYAPFAAFVSAVDATSAVALYRRMEPLLQQAYRDLGFGNKSFHQRLLQVIDVLLATPEPAQPPQVAVVEVRGPAAASTRPWTRYEYVDPALQKLPAGQKILLRVGPQHRAALKAKLRELKEALLQASSVEVVR